MVILGDYLDPYTSFEGITHEQAYDNFVELLKFVRDHKNQVIMLLGNHDLFYFDDNLECCRHDYKNYDAISKLFKDNEDLFKFAHKEGDYLFTHAGVSDKWLLQNNLQELTIDQMVTYLNSNPTTLWQVGYARGGRHRCGSPIWCCWSYEWPHKCDNPYNITQCFSHTRQHKSNSPKSDPNRRLYMFDVLNCFLLENGEITLLS